jgi:hypothetical protein
MTELDTARQIASGMVGSPVRFGNSSLVALRISGTGISERPSIGEKVWRDPKAWLSDEAKARVAGLPVILDHPEGAVLNQEEYEARSAGAIIHAYIASRDGIENTDGPDLWGIARLFLDEGMVEQIASQSTSPGVVFTKQDGNQTITLPDGTVCLVESSPTLIDHLAIVMSGNGAGVWDKGGPNSGVRHDSERKSNMPTEEEMQADKARKDAEAAGNIDKLLSHMDSMTKSMDSMSQRLDAMEKRGDSARRDAEETAEEKADREAQERKDAARKDLQTSEHGTPWNAAKDAKARADSAALVDAQARADRVAQAFGQQAPAPLSGEAPLAYRKRLMRQFVRHSAFKDADLDTIAADAKTFDNVEAIVYADAIKASATPEVAPGHRLKRVRTGPAGHQITEWFGETVFKQLASPSMRVTNFLTPQPRA